MLVMAHYFIIWAIIVVFFDISLSWSTLLVVPGLVLIIINGIWVSMLLAGVGFVITSPLPLWPRRRVREEEFGMEIVE